MKQTREKIASQIAEVKNKYQNEGFEIIGLFGSYARGSADKYSDADIAYRLNYPLFDKKFKGGFAKLLRIEEIKQELQKQLYLKVDLVPIESSNSYFKKRATKDMLYV